MLTSFVLSLWEGLEAALIIGVLLGTLWKLNRAEYQRLIWLGADLAILARTLQQEVIYAPGSC